MKQITATQVRNALSKTNIMKDLERVFVNTINTIYPNDNNPMLLDAIRVIFDYNLKIKIIATRQTRSMRDNKKDDVEIDIPDMLESILYFARIGYHGAGTYFRYISDVMYSDIAEYINRYYCKKDLDWYEFKEIRFENNQEIMDYNDFGRYQISFRDYQSIVVWDYNNVYTWYVEQECGSRWLSLPRDPKSCGMSTGNSLCTVHKIIKE